VIGMSGWTGFAPLTLAKEAGIFKKNGLDVTLKMIPQKDRHSRSRPRRPVRGDDRRDVDRLERGRCRHQADLPDGQELRRRWHGGAQQHREDRRPQGQDGCRLRAGHRTLFHARLVPQEERAVGEGCHRRQP
jgi:hypothetical protein